MLVILQNILGTKASGAKYDDPSMFSHHFNDRNVMVVSRVLVFFSRD